MRNEAAPLGETSVDQFMRRHWQRSPLLVRQAIPGMRPPLEAARLFEMATRDDVESRLVTRRRDRWTLTRGPFAADELPGPRQRDWTLLVQGVDMHDDAAHALLSRFRFVPDARLDDLMISWAAPGGGVGPHVDSYDVFLLQAQGRRRWRIAPPGPVRLDERAPLKILADFAPTETWTLDPGDMLYLPPGWAHEGTAVDGPCMTCSVGFRAPSRLELLRAFLADCADDPGGPDPRYGDRSSPPTTTPGRLPEPMAAALSRWLTDWRPDADRIDDFLGRYLTEPKPQVWFEPPARVPAQARWWQAAQARGVVLDRRSRIAWRGRRIFLNGESFDTAGDAARLRRLADARGLPAGSLAPVAADSPLAIRLRDWQAAGWLHLGPPPARSPKRRADQSA